MIVRKPYALDRNYTLDFEFGSFPGLEIFSQILSWHWAEVATVTPRQGDTTDTTVCCAAEQMLCSLGDVIAFSPEDIFNLYRFFGMQVEEQLHWRQYGGGGSLFHQCLKAEIIKSSKVLKT
jgi:hypothetical protein